jgi:hypothetical protein
MLDNLKMDKWLKENGFIKMEHSSKVISITTNQKD